MTDYNGWKNYETWNVALWLGNDEGLYHLTREWMEDRERMCYELKDYDIFRHTLTELCGETTPDGVRWDDPSLDNDELTECMAELAE